MIGGVKNFWQGISGYVASNSQQSKTPNLNNSSKKFTEKDYAEIRELKLQMSSRKTKRGCAKTIKNLDTDKPKFHFLKSNRLPNNFAEEVLDLEILVEQGKFSMSEVDKLVFLYSQAIEHYEGIDPAKHATFYQRTQRLLNKPSVFEVMKSHKNWNRNKISEIPNEVLAQENGFNFQESRTKAIKGSKSFYTPSRQKMDMNLLLMQEKKQSKQQEMLTKLDMESSFKSELLENDIITQKRNLELRLLRRKAKQRQSSKKNRYSKIGLKDDWAGEYSSIITKLGPSFANESWTEENDILIHEIDSTRDKSESTLNKNSVDQTEEDQNLDSINSVHIQLEA